LKYHVLVQLCVKLLSIVLPVDLWLKYTLHDKYRILSVIKVETGIVSRIAASLMEQTVILVIMYDQDFKNGH